MDYLLLAGGFIGLILGGELLVRGAVLLAHRLGVSPLVIGLTLVGFGTSLPELVTSVEAAFVGSPGIAVGNVVGSNIANILLIVGLAALVRPIAVAPQTARRDGGAMLLATALCLMVVLGGSLDRLTGLGFVAGLGLYLVLTVRESRRQGAAREPDVAGLPLPRMSPALALVSVLGGLAVTILGAKALVAGAVSLAGAAGVSETVIGLTIVAVGTSMPELVTSVIAARRGHSDVALGNILGSNIFNILGILGVTAMLQPLAVPAEIVSFDIWVMAGASVALVVFALTDRRIGRREGGTLLAAYAAYLGYLVLAQG